MEMIPPAGGGSRVADGIARLALIIAAFAAPFFLIPLSYVGIAQAKVVMLTTLVILAALFWLFARITEGAIRIPRSALLYVAGLLPLSYLLSILVTGWSNAAFVGNGVEQDTLAAVAVMSAVVLLTALAFSRTAGGQRSLIQAALFGGLVLFVLQAIHVFVPTFTLAVLTGTTASALGSWHDLGIIAGLSFFLAVVLWDASYFSGWRRPLLFVLAATALFSLIVVHFSDVFWSLAALFAITGFAVVRSGLVAGLSLAAASRRAVLYIFFAVLFALAAFLSPGIWDKLPAPLQITMTEVRPSWQGTFDIARQSLQGPELIFGSGPNSFTRAWGEFKPQGVNLTPFWNADFNFGVGIIPTSVFTAGLVGLLAWAAILLVMLGYAFRFIREVRPLGGSRGLFGGVLLAAGYLVVYHMMYTPTVSITFLTFLALGLLAALAAGDSPQRVITFGVSSIFGAVKMFVLVFLVLCTVLCAGLLARETVSNVFVNRAAFSYQNTHDAGVAQRMIATGLLISPKNDRAHRAAAELGIIRLTELAAVTDANNQTQVAALQKALQETIQHGLTAVSLSPENYQNWLLLAQVYSSLAGANVEGAYEQAVTAYQKALATNPQNPVPKLRLAQLAVARGDMVSARAALNDAIAIKQDFAAAYFLLSQVEATDGKGDAAVAAAATAAQLVPQDPLGWFNLGFILYSGGAYRNAATALQQAVSLSPEYSNALFYLGLSLQRLGDGENAARVFDRIGEINPSDTWVRDVAANIRAGKDPFEGVVMPQANPQ